MPSAMGSGKRYVHGEVAQNDIPQNVIVVEGRGTVEISPDLAVLHVNLEADADSAGEALSIVSDRSTSVLSAVRQHEIDDTDMTTTGLNVFPQMDHGGLRIHHYRASYGFRIRIRDISQGPGLIESISSAAGDALRLGGFHLTASDPEAARTEAAVLAVGDARQRAARIAEAASVRLGRVLSITEGQGLVFSRPRAMMAHAAPMPGGPPLEAGSEAVTVQATVTFEIAQ